MEFRDSHADLEDHFMDVRYLVLAANPVGTVRAIYDRFGFPLSVEDESRMEAFATIERNKRRLGKILSRGFHPRARTAISTL